MQNDEINDAYREGIIEGINRLEASINARKYCSPGYAKHIVDMTVVREEAKRLKNSVRGHE